MLINGLPPIETWAGKKIILTMIYMTEKHWSRLITTIVMINVRSNLSQVRRSWSSRRDHRKHCRMTLDRVQVWMWNHRRWSMQHKLIIWRYVVEMRRGVQFHWLSVGQWKDLIKIRSKTTVSLLRRRWNYAIPGYKSQILRLTDMGDRFCLHSIRMKPIPVFKITLIPRKSFSILIKVD